MSYEDRYDAMSDYNSQIATDTIAELTATEICDLFMRLDLDELQKLEMVEALIDSINTNGHKYKLVEVD